MEVLVSFLKPQDQHPTDSNVIISIWKTEPISVFPYKGKIREVHDIGMGNPALGFRRQARHYREVVIEDQEGGAVAGCLESNNGVCWDERRFGSCIKTVGYLQTRKGLVLTLQEVIR